MAKTRITINGQEYENPEAMPPSVRQKYEEAMRLIGPSLAGGPSGGSTRVFTTGLGKGADVNLTVNQIVTVNGRTYGSVHELPPELRKQYEDALKGSTPHSPKTSVHLSLNVDGPQVRHRGDYAKSPDPPPLPIEASTLVERIRQIPVSLAIIVVIALILWATLR
ncbi:MAG: hypothetical protein ACRENS_06260 [Candidatus Eiseniibacteriota bacterium]